MSPAAVNLLTLGVTKSISSWLLVEVTLSSASISSLTFFLFRFGFDGAGGYEDIFCVRVCVYVCMYVRVHVVT